MVRTNINKRRKLSLLFITVTVLLTGCWDRLEIEDRAVVLGVGIDLVGAEEAGDTDGLTSLQPLSPDRQYVKVTAQIAVPGRIPLGPGEEGGGGKSGQDPVWTISAVGETVNGAFLTLQQELADRIFLGHLRVIIISEAFARQGVTTLNDFFRRNPQVRRLTWIAVGKGSAEVFMQTKPELERVPALYLLAMLDHSVKLGKYPNEFAGKFWSKVSSDGQEPNLPYLSMKENGKIKMDGMALFQDDRMVDTIKPLEIGLYMAITNTRQGGYATYVEFPEQSARALYQATRRASKMKSSIENGKPVIHLSIKVEGDIDEVENDARVPHDQWTISVLEEQIEQAAKQGIEDLIHKTQQLKIDIFGFGEYIRAHQASYWNTHVKNKETWRTIYPDIEVRVETDYRIRRIGLKEM